MEQSSSASDGSVASVCSRLLLWCQRRSPGIAQVEFSNDVLRREVVGRLRRGLEEAGLRLEDLQLPVWTPEGSVAEILVERLGALEPSIVSVDGLAAALPPGGTELSDSIYRLSFKREPLFATGHRQIWWVPTYLGELLEKTAPDLESWILLKLRLDAVDPEVSAARPSARRRGIDVRPEAPPLRTAESVVNPVEARQRAEDAMARFERALEQGTPATEALAALVRPALELLRRAHLEREARDVDARVQELILRHMGPPTGGPELGQAARDVFISYTGADRAWAVWLEGVLRQAGYSCVMQEYDFRPGESFLLAMNEALAQCRWTLCLLSPAFLASQWCTEEWLAALIGKRLVPVRIAECALPPMLAHRVYVDLVGLSEQAAQKAVVAALAKLEGTDLRPDRPAFPGAAFPRIASFPGTLPPIWNVPVERNRFFTGREASLAAIRGGLAQGATAAVTQAIQGLGGVGKTQVALEYAYRFAEEYAGVWWLRAEEPATLASDFALLAGSLGIEQATDQNVVIRAVRRELSRRERFLLVFDNATSPESISAYLPQGPRRQVIVTTRRHDWPGAIRAEVDVLDEDLAVEFLLKRTGQPDRDGALEVAQRLGRLPLALEQAAAYMVRCRKSLGAYAKLLAGHGLELLDRGEPYQYKAKVSTTWSLSFDELGIKCPAGVALLNLCAFLAPEAIHLPDLDGAAVRVPESLRSVLVSDLDRDQAKGELLELSLVRAEGEAISVHRLVQEVTRERMTEDVRREWLGAAIRVVTAVFPAESDDVRTWDVCARWIGHTLAVVNVGQALELEPQATSWLLDRAAAYFHGKADYERAEPLFRRAVAVAERAFGPDHPAVAACLNNLAQLLQDTGRLAEAESLIRRVLDIGESSFGPSHANVGSYLNNLAQLLQDTNRLAEAESLFRRALDIAESSFGPNSPNTALRLNNLALLLQATGRIQEAEPLFRRAIDIAEKSYGPDHPHTAISLANLALLLQATGRIQEAERLFRRALDIDESSLGPDHPDVAIVLDRLALLLQDTNRPSEAEPLLRRALDIFEKKLGPNHPRTLACGTHFQALLAPMAP